MRNETPRFSESCVVPEQVAPVVEQCLQESVDIEIFTRISPVCAASEIAPAGPVPVMHVFRDIRIESLPERFQALIDPLLGF